MKAVYSAVILLMVASAGAEMRSEVQLDGGEVVSFRYDIGSGGEARLLSLERGRTSETIWASREAEPVFLDVGREDRYYEFMELVAAESHDGIIVAAFKASPGRYKFVPEYMASKDYAFNRQGVVTDFDTVVRVFVKRDGWHPHLTFYPQTFYGDTINEAVAGVAILGDGVYELKYENTWSIVGGEGDSPGGSFKVSRSEDEIRKQFRWQGGEGLLLGTKDGADLIYVENSVWWSGMAPFESEGGKLRRNQYNRLLADHLELAKGSGHPVERCRFYTWSPR